MGHREECHFSCRGLSWEFWRFLLGLGRVGEEGKHACTKHTVTHTYPCTSGRVCTCGHARIHKHTPLPAHFRHSFSVLSGLFNSHVLVSSLITHDNNLIKKRCPGIHCFSRKTYPPLPVYPLAPLFMAPSQMYPLWPYLSPFLTLSRPLPLSFTPAELCETPLYCIPTSLTCTILTLATLSSFSSTLLHSSSCSWPWSPHSCMFPMPFDFKPFLLSLCLLLCHIEGIFPPFFARPPLPLMSVPHRVPYNLPNHWCCGCNIYVSLYALCVPISIHRGLDILFRCCMVLVSFFFDKTLKAGKAQVWAMSSMIAQSS